MKRAPAFNSYCGALTSGSAAQGSADGDRIQQAMSFLEFRKFAPLVEVCEGGHEQLGDHLVPTRCVVELRRSPAWVSGKDEIEERHLELGASSTSGDVRATTASSIAAHINVVAIGASNTAGTGAG